MNTPCVGSIPASAGEPGGASTTSTTSRVYPRECGGTFDTALNAAIAAGLSPRVRGNRRAEARSELQPGSIPASAGEPAIPTATARQCWVYPRECGGTFASSATTTAGMGLSPRVRGNLAPPAIRLCAIGSIPASAGEPPWLSPTTGITRVYPRECGGTRERRAQSLSDWGLSPRVRGNHKRNGRRRQTYGSIPASAGEPCATRRFGTTSRVYPRECGGTRICTVLRYVRMGLSPRVRGNHGERGSASSLAGSIPASAGEPRSRTRCSCFPGVYPRECGGTDAVAGGPRPPAGLSPRVRGNHHSRVRVALDVGSIPASAGEPGRADRQSTYCRVYPRECGGTVLAAYHVLTHEGLSPRVRGNQAHLRVVQVAVGSIPASAGEPSWRRGFSRRPWVYPRECGGTFDSPSSATTQWGLSPRVRGNLRLAGVGSQRCGSIPASAGEPQRGQRDAGKIRVYPRECGGTHGRGRFGFRHEGLSPRVRGNRTSARRCGTAAGSIPASAGEPTWLAARPRVARVYPRECGGTSAGNRSRTRPRGLSPRVRGNPRSNTRNNGAVGSIPASAGEPP